MQTKPQGSMAVAIVSGVLVLATGPMALAMLVLQSGAEGLAELFNEGGAFSYLVLGAGALSTLVAAVLMAVSVRKPVLGLSALVVFVAPMLAAVLGTKVGAQGTLAAIVHAAPADQRTILMGSIGELMSLQLQALALGTSACFAVALASLAGLLTTGRGPRVVAALSSGLLGVSLGATAFVDAQLYGALKAVAHASPADRATILVGTIQELQPFTLFGNGSLFAALVITALGVAVLMRGEARAAAIAMGASVLVAVVGLRGANAMIDRQLSDASASLPPMKDLGYLELDGVAPRTLDAVELTPGQVDRQVGLGLQRSWRDEKAISIGLSRTLERDALLRALQVAHYAKAEVELMGSPKQRTFDVPARYQALTANLSEYVSAVPVRVLFTGEVCEACVGTATLSGDALEVKFTKGEATQWTLSSSRPWSRDELPSVEFEWGGPPEALARAALTALSHEHVLAVRVAPPEPEPTPPGDDE